MTEFLGKNKPTKQIFGAIDLGSRNCRLLIAEKELDRPPLHLDSVSRVVCLGEGVARTGRLSKVAMDRALEGLSYCVKRMKQYNPQAFRIVSTEACRRAQNQRQFLNRVRREIGIDLEVISFEEEALFTLFGCYDMVAPGSEYALIFDIGGGSTEIIWAKIIPHQRPELIDCVSIPHGVVSLAESFKTNVFQHYQEICEETYGIAKAFSLKNEIDQIGGTKNVQFIGTSGTTTTIAAVHLNLRFYDRDKIDGTSLTFKEAESVIKYIQLLSSEERLIHPCIGSSKDDLILGGLAIFDGIYKAWPQFPMTVTDRGVRDGIIYDLVNRHDTKIQP